MSGGALGIGDVIRVKSMRVVGENAKVRIESVVNANKNHWLVCVVLGEVPKGEAFDAEAALRNMGWEKISPPLPENPSLLGNGVG